jgi:hypothetical protein
VAVTKAEFDAAMEKGWERRGYCAGYYYGIATACAIGAAAIALKMTADQLEEMLPLPGRITRASDAAGNKTAAIAAVKAIQW